MIGSPALHFGHSSGANDAIGRSTSATVGKPKSTGSRRTITPSATGCGSRFAHDFEHFFDRAAGRDDVFDDERAVLRPECKTAPQRRDTAFFFNEDRTQAELAGNLVAKHDAANRRAHDDVRKRSIAANAR